MAGAWSTLLLSARAKKKFNGAILFAPASGGKERILKNPMVFIQKTLPPIKTI